MPRFLFSTLTFCFYLGLYGQVVQQGKADIRKADFSEGKNIALDGEWLFYPDQLISSVQSAQNKQSVYMSVPKLWNELGMSSLGYGTYAMTLIKSSGTPALMIKVPHIFSSSKLFVNGSLLKEVGTLADSEKDYSPARLVSYVSLAHFTSDTLHFHLQVANWTHSKGGIGSSILLGTQDSILETKTRQDSYDMFLSGCLVMGGFFFLGLYFHGQQEKTALYFALFCIAYAYRVIGWGNYLLNDLADIPYQIAIRLEYATLYLSNFFFANYVLYLFPQDSPKKAIKLFMVICLVWTAFTLFPIYVLSKLNIYFVYLMLVGFGLLCYVFFRSIVFKRAGYNYVIYSTVGILVIFAMKTLNYLHIIEEARTFTVIGEILFFFFQSLMLSQLFSTSWREAKNRAEESVRAKSDFLSVMSHEIRTPLNAVIGTTYHLIDENPRQDQLKDLNNLKSSSDNLLTLVNNLLDFSKIEMGKLELEETEVELREFCHAQLLIFDSEAEKKSITLTFEYDTNLPRFVLIDKTRISQIIINLIGNAIKFTEVGSITFSISEIKSGKEDVLIEFSVKDTGIGIEPEKIDRIFDFFEQANTTISRKYGGTGLGLAITRKLLTIMGSEIKVSSEPDQGSQFSFRLVLTKATRKEERETVLVKDLSGFNVLLVEDNAMNVLIAQRLLEKWHLQVDVAENGVVAVTKAQESDYDLILMDLQMPVMGGFEATDLLRQQGYTKPIVALTAASSSEDSLRVKNAGMDDFISKPYNPEDLFIKIRNLLKGESNSTS